LVFLGQTFEGGISAKPDIEAHGAYAFCALACLCILGDPHVIVPKYASLLYFKAQNADKRFPDISMFPG
jgi:prenyltransferase beta subunit